jgi:hypothetical protein
MTIKILHRNFVQNFFSLFHFSAIFSSRDTPLAFFQCFGMSLAKRLPAWCADKNGLPEFHETVHSRREKNWSGQLMIWTC